LKLTQKTEGLATRLFAMIDAVPTIYLGNTTSMRGPVVKFVFLMCFVSVLFSFKIHAARKKAMSNAVRSLAANRLYYQAVSTIFLGKHTVYGMQFNIPVGT